MRQTGFFRRAQTMKKVNRRDFLQGSMATVATASGLAVLNEPNKVQAASRHVEHTFPTLNITPIASILVGAEISFDYPDEDSPALLLRLSEPVEGGIGPSEDIVAFSTLCTHKGCLFDFVSKRNVLICPCHWSSFDPSKGGRLIIGQASQSLPQIRLDQKDGMIRAIGVDGLIYGRQTNVL